MMNLGLESGSEGLSPSNIRIWAKLVPVLKWCDRTSTYDIELSRPSSRWRGCKFDGNAASNRNVRPRFFSSLFWPG